MSALPREPSVPGPVADRSAPATVPRQLLDMTVPRLDAVLAIEASAYAFPWSHGNFVDSLAAGYVARVLAGSGGELLGYFVAMAGVDEFHLLNITVAPGHQGQGHAVFMLDALTRHCRAARAGQLWLEVRASNERALRIYQRYGFRHIGLRRRYYPAPRGQREDAVVMSLAIRGEADAAREGHHAVD